jgi:hypothetical protein
MAESMSERSPRPSSVPWLRSRYARLAVRGLVVAGFAGVAWLLSSSAAHASSTAHTSPSGHASWSEATSPAGLIPALVAESNTAAVLTTATDLVTRVVPVPVAGHAVERVLASPALQPVDAAPDPRQRLLQLPLQLTLTSPAHVAAPAKSAAVSGPAKKTAAQKTVRQADTVTTAATGMAPSVSSGPTRTVMRQRAERGHAPALAPAADDPTDVRRTHHVPLLPRPAPAPAFPGAGLTSGVPSTGSVLNQDGGIPAIVPAAMAAAVAGNRPVAADDVEVRSLVAESPTVSPD